MLSVALCLGSPLTYRQSRLRFEVRVRDRVRIRLTVRVRVGGPVGVRVKVR